MYKQSCLLAAMLASATAFHLAPPMNPAIPSLQPRSNVKVALSRRPLFSLPQIKKPSLRALFRPKAPSSRVVARARDNDPLDPSNRNFRSTDDMRNKTATQLLVSAGLSIAAWFAWPQMFLGWSAFMVIAAMFRYLMISSNSTLPTEIGDDIGRLAMTAVPAAYSGIQYQSYLRALGLAAVTKYDAAWAFIALAPTVGAQSVPSMKGDGAKVWRATVGILAQLSQEVYYRGIMWKVGAAAGHPLWLLIAETTFWQALTKTATDPLNYPRLTVGNLLPLLYHGAKMGLLRWVSGSPTLPVLVVGVQALMDRLLPPSEDLAGTFDRGLREGKDRARELRDRADDGTSWLGEGRANTVRDN